MSKDYMKPYFYSEWMKAVERMAQQEVYETMSEPESQFKKPYLQQISYPLMEYEWDYRENPYGINISPRAACGNCELKGKILGDSLLPCSGSFEFVLECASEVIKITPVSCELVSLSLEGGNTYRGVVITSLENVKNKVAYGIQAIHCSGHPYYIRFIPSECKEEECPTVFAIGYTTQQMSCNGTQQLWVDPPSAPENCEWQWEIISGGGSLNPTTGMTTTYTAPSSNPDCANNPTIRLSNNTGQSAELKIAINCFSSYVRAYIQVWFESYSAGGAQCWRKNAATYDCSGNIYNGEYCIGEDYCCNPPTSQCSKSYLITRCRCDLGCCIGRNGNVCDGISDERLSTWKQQGCCPAALL